MHFSSTCLSGTHLFLLNWPGSNSGIVSLHFVLALICQSGLEATAVTHAAFVHGCTMSRAKAVLLLLKKEVELCKLQADIREQVGGVLRTLAAYKLS